MLHELLEARVRTAAEDMSTLLDESQAGPVPASDEAKPPRQGASRRGLVFMYRYGVVLALGVLVLVFSLVIPETFFTTGNLVTIMGSQSIFMIMALGLTAPLATGEFDLSIASLLGFSGALLGELTVRHGMSLAPAIAIVVAAGLVVGLVNGFLVVRVQLNAFIATLGTGTIIAGCTLALTSGQVISGIPDSLVTTMRKDILGLPLPVYVGLLLAVITWYVYEHTPIGRQLFFTGESREAARLAGIPVDAVRFYAFVVSALASTLAGLIVVGELSVADPALGPDYLLPVYAAAFLGATTIKPGRYNAWGTVVALYLLVTGITGLQLLGLESWIQQVFNGTALVLAVMLARWAALKAPDIA
jgi:ribose transport system permease protein